MDLGGFMGADRIVNPARLAALVRKGAVRYFLLSAGGRDRGAFLPERFRESFGERGRFRGPFGALGPRNSNDDLVQWVSKSCRVVPPSAYHAISPSFGGFGGQQLYDCGAVTRRST
jgi:hypothetical protein